MSMYLFDEQPILANKALARELGLNEAPVLQQINYWIEINKKSGNNYHDGKYWTYNSIRAWQEKDFDVSCHRKRLLILLIIMKSLRIRCQLYLYSINQ